MSFDGKACDTWDIDTLDSIGLPHLCVSSDEHPGVNLAIAFDDKDEHVRFYDGVKFCRAKVYKVTIPTHVSDSKADTAPKALSAKTGDVVYITRF